MESAKRWEKVFGFTHKKFGEKIKKSFAVLFGITNCLIYIVGNF